MLQTMPLCAYPCIPAQAFKAAGRLLQEPCPAEHSIVPQPYRLAENGISVIAMTVKNNETTLLLVNSRPRGLQQLLATAASQPALVEPLPNICDFNFQKLHPH